MNKKILLVDDSRTTLMMEEMILGSATDYTLITAKDGREAVQKARSERPDLVLMDVVMPHMSGLDACRELRSDDSTRSLPVILVTTKGQEEDVEAGFEHGCSEYLTKPINAHELVTLVKTVLGD